MTPIVSEGLDTDVKNLPAWFRQDIPDMNKIRSMKKMFRSSGLYTVCESAHCPNMGKCWGRGVATFMILGETCTRACRFCAVKAGRPKEVDDQEPRNVALAVKELNLRYAVITSVARDDLPDEGAGQFVKVIQESRKANPSIKIEVLIPDFSNRIELLQMITDIKPEVVSHNIESVRRLSKKIRPQAQYQRSLDVLKNFKALDKSIFTKSSIMIGLGEDQEEIIEAMNDLRKVDCDILTIGQYLSPSQMKRHLPVEKFYTPDEFDRLRDIGYSLGFKHVMSAPLVRSSYIAEEGYNECFESIKSPEKLN